MACQSKVCTTVTILNAERVEPLMEQFSVSLETVQEDSRIRVNSEPSRVVILDNDGIFMFKKAMCINNIMCSFFPESVVSLQYSIYQATESVGMVEVCVHVESPTVSCPITTSFSVQISTTDNTAGLVLPACVLLKLSNGSIIAPVPEIYYLNIKFSAVMRTI